MTAKKTLNRPSRKKLKRRFSVKQSLKSTSSFKSWQILTAVCVIAAVGYFVVQYSFAGGKTAKQYDTKGVPFIDISSPQCGRLNSIGNYNYGIVGLNGTYMNFGINPCLNAETRHFRTYDVYVGANYPSSQCPRSMSPYDCGRKAASFNLGVINNIARINPRAFWIDVESGHGIPWSTQVNNRNFLKGLHDGMQRGLRFAGYYSTDQMWRQITGNMPFNGSAWYATGATNSRDAKAKCGKSFGGKKALYVQYVKYNLDYNVRC